MTNEKRERLFTQENYEALLFLAEDSPKRRARMVASVSPEGEFVILNGVLPDSYIRPHKYENSHTSNILMVVRGVLKVLVFDDGGAVTDTTLVSKGKTIDIPADTWHSVVALTPCFFVEGKREFEKREIFAPWAPEEGTEEAREYLETLREKVVDKGETQG